MLITEMLALAAGFALLTWSADRFVVGAAGTARLLGVPTLLVGIIVAGFGTSAPEILISGLAAWEGRPGIAVGNALGSNVANIGLIVGTTAIAYPLVVRRGILRREMPLMGAVTVMAFVLLADRQITRFEGLLLLAALAGVLYWLTRQAGQGDPLADALEAELNEDMPKQPSWVGALGWLMGGLALLLASSRLIVWASVTIARSLGISDLVIGLSIVALGTSLPELATCIASARKSESDIALGNIIGSNIFNLLAVLGLAGFIAPLTAASAALTRDFPLMAALTLAAFALAWRPGGNAGHLGRLAGIVFLASYIAYQSILALSQL